MDSDSSDISEAVLSESADSADKKNVDQEELSIFVNTSFSKMIESLLLTALHKKVIKKLFLNIPK